MLIYEIINLMVFFFGIVTFNLLRIVKKRIHKDRGNNTQSVYIYLSVANLIIFTITVLSFWELHGPFLANYGLFWSPFLLWVAGMIFLLNKIRT